MDLDKLDEELVSLVKGIDARRREVEENAKKTYQYKHSKKYRQDDERYLDMLLLKRNTLVQIVNYIRSDGDIKALAELDYR